MELHNLNSVPPGGYNCGELCALGDEYDIADLTKAGFASAWYYYSQGGYEGCGQLIGQGVDGRWGHMDLGHCSCYGPLQGKANWRDTLDALAESMSDGLRDECSNVIAAARGAA